MGEISRMEEQRSETKEAYKILVRKFEWRDDFYGVGWEY
jgi:hypothetical protein